MDHVSDSITSLILETADWLEFYCSLEWASGTISLMAHLESIVLFICNKSTRLCVDPYNDFQGRTEFLIYLSKEFLLPRMNSFGFLISSLSLDLRLGCSRGHFLPQDCDLLHFSCIMLSFLLRNQVTANYPFYDRLSPSFAVFLHAPAQFIHTFTSSSD